MQGIAINYIRNILLGTQPSQKAGKGRGTFTLLYYFGQLKKTRKFISSERNF